MGTGTTAESGKSGRQKAAEAVVALEALLRAHDDAGTTPELRRGTLNLRSLCKALGVSRSTANQNPAFRQTLDAWCAAKGIEVGADVAHSAAGAGTASQSDTTPGEADQPASPSDRPAPAKVQAQGQGQGKGQDQSQGKAQTHTQGSTTSSNDKHTIKRLESDLRNERKRVVDLEKRLAESIAQNSHLYTLIKQYQAREAFLTEKGKGGKR
jgi:hypothetical protein